MEAVRDEVAAFEMPGAGMPDFRRNAMTIALAGIYDLRLHHDEVVQPVLRFWKVFDRDDLGPRGEAAREDLARLVADLDARAATFVARREEATARRAGRTGTA
jgi:acyl-[acyl-carrier-protein] desaturase